MMDSLPLLIAALREELQQYGEMLARLDHQQDCVMRRAADDLLQSVEAVHGQGIVIYRARRERELLQSELARHAGLATEASFAQLILKLPMDYRPLVQALIQENNELLVRVQQRARQNHLLLARSLELMQNLIGSLFPAAHNPVYGEAGTLFASGAPLRPRYEAVG